MSEPFADLIWNRATGILAGRGQEIGLSERTIVVFSALWSAKGDYVSIRDRFGIDKAQNSVRALRMVLPRFGLVIRSDRAGGHRLVDLQRQHDKVSA